MIEQFYIPMSNLIQNLNRFDSITVCSDVRHCRGTVFRHCTIVFHTNSIGLNSVNCGGRNRMNTQKCFHIHSSKTEFSGHDELQHCPKPIDHPHERNLQRMHALTTQKTPWYHLSPHEVCKTQDLIFYQSHRNLYVSKSF